ncbi:bifunctional phosphoribosylaminoimidazolecarboxamide formyltransferase/IMP cyclohydrolase PurH [Deinococcus psychrotolerans]|uniref:Bifunctional purine biosynthesis protein PurH n=1 Tax=Deinococcus psychrotolerans TaxID=2489213 RepID=A0A3G8YC07_9DEIO|nr:bifunctional phosphoribosylaminoimidazolecarboxamide formyltransferase/IMP cyclohydrolase [Deinococcus psychrotolerans]AZI42470.1 bifunctional phosphoribosylaminoimidazolecarboxamide formyltransferase/IMP cyclohydrolase PurH [Deinococcus psychrotolerans]
MSDSVQHPQKQALISVSDKSGVVDFARALTEQGWAILSTGGTLSALQAAGVPATKVADVTGFPEILDGRVKTLHPKIHGGILARRTPEHLSELAQHGIGPIDLVCVNLYPFCETVASGADLETAIENIDIGGPAMIRAAAKNFESVLILVDPADYPLALQAEVSQTDRRHLAAKAYAHTSSYDAAITAYLSEPSGDSLSSDSISGEDFPKEVSLPLTQIADLRYGENPHQQATVYRLGAQTGPVLDAEVLSGKAMSFNNYADTDAAWALVSEFADSSAACVAVKHANPCGVAVATTPKEAWERARDADTLSVFGGVVAINRPIDLETAKATRGTFLEVLIAPDIDADALTWLREKKPDLRVLRAGKRLASGLDYRPLIGGFLAQKRDERLWDDLCPEVVTNKQPTEAEWKDLAFAWLVAKHARSNNVVLARGGVTVGIGAGAVSRIWAAERAVQNAGEMARGAVMASEAFFPFDDVVRLAGSVGVSAIIQPGGAKRDPEVIAAANELGISMVLTGSRHFKH